jgi:hypothetical protein
MTKFVAAVLIVIASVGAANAHPLDDEDGVGAGGCAPWVCGENGPQLTGIQVDGNRSSALAAAVTLPSGEIVRLGATASEQPRLQVAAKKGLRDKAQQYETAVRDKQVTPAEQSSRHGMSAGTARRR